MKEKDFTIKWHGNNKILCCVTHKKTKISAWGTASNDPEENKKSALALCERLIKEEKKK
jgi:hypothetical protein